MIYETQIKELIGKLLLWIPVLLMVSCGAYTVFFGPSLWFTLFVFGAIVGQIIGQSAIILMNRRELKERKERKERKKRSVDDVIEKMSDFRKQLIEDDELVDEIWWEDETGVHTLSKTNVRPWEKPMTIMHRAFYRAIAPILINRATLKQHQGEVSLDAFVKEVKRQFTELVGEELLDILIKKMRIVAEEEEVRVSKGGKNVNEK
ncbi:MAG: hypothetical protein GWO20_05790 [Candidatus Korarchaeota archaeon]|nr:hypothetical protein [Candidatus Korarchaeota archaeon]NIU82967.1 hypothetical protein [Candidatus Thorarchaeota archaeon]NIW13390.1 hypothetical protein [Candidatus Thorarchaeota archaeon]NIW51490.1 hypothetical protein [Candidatus Korarchaeota archaeon]